MKDRKNYSPTIVAANQQKNNIDEQSINSVNGTKMEISINGTKMEINGDTEYNHSHETKYRVVTLFSPLKLVMKKKKKKKKKKGRGQRRNPVNKKVPNTTCRRAYGMRDSETEIDKKLLY
jgi:hypothetical protein